MLLLKDMKVELVEILDFCYLFWRLLIDSDLLEGGWRQLGFVKLADLNNLCTSALICRLYME